MAHRINIKHTQDKVSKVNKTNRTKDTLSWI